MVFFCIPDLRYINFPFNSPKNDVNTVLDCPADRRGEIAPEINIPVTLFWLRMVFFQFQKNMN